MGPVGVLFLLGLVLAPAAWAGHPGTDRGNREAEALAAASPESEVNVAGRPRRGKTSYTEVTGLLEGHLHAMAFEFLGGSVHCGKPWDERGIAFALKDCPDHAGNGAGAVLENVLSNGSPLAQHRRLAHLPRLAATRVAHPRDDLLQVDGASLARWPAVDGQPARGQPAAV